MDPQPWVGGDSLSSSFRGEPVAQNRREVLALTQVIQEIAPSN
jgi:hypothetical protein